MDGLVSTGILIPGTILKIIFPFQKIFPKNFIHILIVVVDKQRLLYIVNLYFMQCLFVLIVKKVQTGIFLFQ